MLLSKKKSFNSWITVSAEGETKIEFLIDYLTREQEQHLQSIQFGDEYSGGDLGLKYAQRFLKYTIKDWRSEINGRVESYLLNDDNEQIKCELINNELKDDIWWALVRNPEMALSLWKQISEELEFTANDKKK